MPSRRHVLGLGSATLALLAGCAAQSPSGADAPDSPSETDPTDSASTPAETASPTPDVDVRVRDPVVTPTLVGMNSPDSIGVYGDRGEQFVVVGVGTRGRLPFDRGEFTLATEATTYRPTTARDVTGHYSLWRDGDPYEPGTGGYLLFRLPKPLDAERVTLRWPDGEHVLSEDALTRLPRPPTTFAVREFAAPESVTSGSEATLTLTVENTGDADGTFVGALNRVGPLIAYTPVEAVSLDVAAGESETWTHSYAPSLDGGTETRRMRFLMPWRGGDERSATDVEPAE